MQKASLKGITELCRGCGLRFLIGVTAVCVVIGASSLNSLVIIYRDPQPQSCGFHITFLLTALTSDTFSPFVAIVSILPFSGNYVDEVRSKFVRFSLLRTSYSSYLLSHIAVCFLLGGTVILSGILVAYFICALAFLPMEKPAINEVSQLPTLTRQCLLLFLNGSLWAMLGMALSTVMESKYIAYVSPFVVYYLLIILYERYFPKAYLIYPREWLNPSEKWPMGVWGVAIFVLELTALLGLVFYHRGKRRLEQL